MTHLQKQLIETYEKEGYSAVLDFWKKNTGSIKKLTPKEVSILNNMMERYCLVNNDEKNLKNIFSGKTENTPQEQEILKALKRFGFLLSEGGVVTKNEYDAEKIFIMLAEKGSSEDTYNLAERYMKGDGIIKDIQKAIEYFVKASKDGNKKASFILGEIYMKGEYIPKDKSQALKWYLLANEKNNSSSNDFSTMIIPDGITCIEESAFEGFENLVKVVIPDSVKEIGHRSFSSCNNLKEVIISNKNIFIKYDAFKDCICLSYKTKKLLCLCDDYVFIKGNFEIKDFYIGQYPVTQKLYERIMGKNPSYFKGAMRPVESVSWFDAINFCNELSKLEGLQPCYINNDCNFKANGYRLPTKAEWDYVARSEKIYKFSGSYNLDEVAWYGGNSSGKTHDVGQKNPNDHGLYDMCGNVSEWCQDSPPDSSDARYDSGGDWNSHEDQCSLYSIDWRLPDTQFNTIGFRIVRSAET